MTTVQFDQVSKLFRQHHAGAPDGDLWALKDVSFACEEGEVLGLVGRNGCGKSTLLKMAARVTSPTSGAVTCAKPVAPMLELGAGFHPDLTGRENIHLNGCLLGLGWRVKPSLLDEIVAFAEVEQHIDTPVKHYSSGMYARLGFAVAVHSPARVLLVDEVLSVGDQLFQQKCFTRMKYLRDRGMTILLVSHESKWIRDFCSRALVIDGGRIIADTKPEHALRIYERRLYGLDNVTPGVEIGNVEVSDLDGVEIQVRVSYDTRGLNRACLFVARVRREDGVYCATCIHEGPPVHGNGRIAIELGGLNLGVGLYAIEMSIEDGDTLMPLATLSSSYFQVHGAWDSKRGYDGILKLSQHWSFD